MSRSSGFSSVPAVTVLRLQRHAADRTCTRLVANNLGMHGAGPLRFRGRYRDLGLQRHAALGTCAGLRLAHLGIHGADIRRSWTLHPFCSFWRKDGRRVRIKGYSRRLVGEASAGRNLHRFGAQLHHGAHAAGLVVRREVLLRIGFEFLRATPRAEVIELALILHRRRGLRRIDIHSANWIFVELCGSANPCGASLAGR